MAEPVAWSDSSARAVLQLMAESVAEMIGFEVVTLSVVLDSELVTIAYSGPEEFREQVFQTDSASILDPVIAGAEQWGRFHFLAAEKYDGHLDGTWVVVAEQGDDHPDAWHPLDVLIGTLRDDEGQLRGILSVDRPSSGRRPDEAQRRLLERYAAQAERAVLTAFEREEMLHQIGHAEAARRLIRSTSMTAHASLDDVLRHTHGPLVDGFDASGSWIQVLEPGDGAGDRTRGLARDRAGQPVELSDAVVGLARRLAPRLWEAQRVIVVDAEDGALGVDPEEQARFAGSALLAETRRQLVELGLGSVLAVPLGAGRECLGFLALTRRLGDPPWSPVEVDSALQIGHDLGAALLTARALERERAMVLELQQVHDYRTQLIATLSHELRTPLTVISGNLEMLGTLDLEPLAERFHAAMTRGTTRMHRVVDDLLLLAQVRNPDHPLVAERVDLSTVAADVVALVRSAAQAKSITLDLDVRRGAGLLVDGDPAELDRLVGNLVSNAVKYTPDGGTVGVSVARSNGSIVVRVRDDGIGIGEEEQSSLFQPFYRTTNPAALREQGSGLGLAIVATIVDRHGGRVEVDSALGAGTTFTVDLPGVPQ